MAGLFCLHPSAIFEEDQVNASHRCDAGKNAGENKFVPAGKTDTVFLRCREVA
jgi:hypothetical protein